jgi:hypothetical protein
VGQFRLASNANCRPLAGYTLRRYTVHCPRCLPQRPVKERRMTLTTLLIIVVVVLLLGGGGFFFRRR